MDEPVITINGTTLSVGQAMTLRVAIGSFAMSLHADGLGDDEHGRMMVEGYLARAHEIAVLMAAVDSRAAKT